MTENQEIAQEELPIPEPQQSEIVLSKKEIQDKIDYFWLEVDKGKKFDEYASDWKELNYYRDLKLKLYK